MTADLDRACPHPGFACNVDVNRIGRGTDDDPGEIIAYSAEVTIRCAECDEPFRFIGVQAGLSFDKPMCSPEETEIRLPIRPASSDPDFGLGIPGFAIGYRAAPERN